MISLKSGITFTPSYKWKSRVDKNNTARNNYKENVNDDDLLLIIFTSNGQLFIMNALSLVVLQGNDYLYSSICIIHNYTIVC